jgi:hypothetical protein
MFNLKNSVFLIIGIIIGMSTSQLFNGCNDTPVTIPIVKVDKPTTLEKEVVQIEKAYQQKVEALDSHSQQLSQQLKRTTQTLAQVRKKNTQLQTQVYGLIDGQQNEVDTAEQLQTCASLVATVTALIQSSNEQDSLYEAANSNLSTQLSTKDSTLQLKDNQYKELKLIVEKSIAQQEVLYHQNKQYQKQFIRQKIKSKVLSAAVLVLSGLTANYLLQH